MATRRASAKTPPRDVYQQVTDKLLASLERGVIPWAFSDWDVSACSMAPYNAVSGHIYRGWNQLALTGRALEISTETYDPRFLTFNQAKEKGWHVKRGEKSELVYLYKKILVNADSGAGRGQKRESSLNKLDAKKAGEKLLASAGRDGGTDPGDNVKSIWVLRAYNVFHASQIEGIPPVQATPITWSASEGVRAILAGMQGQGLKLLSDTNKAAYAKSLDRLRMPVASSFVSQEAYDAVLCHELVHATGHTSRLNRQSLMAEVEKPEEKLQHSAEEELVAEMGAAMLCAQLGINYDHERHAAYIDSWMKAIKADKRLVMRASGQAVKACEYLLALAPELSAKLRDSRKVNVTDPDEIDLETFDLNDIAPDLAATSDEDALWMNDVASAILSQEAARKPAAVGMSM